MEEVSALAEEQALWEAGDTSVTEQSSEPPAESAAPAVEEKAEPPTESQPATEEVQEPAVVATPEEKEAPKLVPLAALQEERDKRQKAEQELAIKKAQEAERQRLLDEQRRVAEQQAAQTPEEAVKAEIEKEIGKRPSEEDDLLAAVEWDRQYDIKRSLLHARRAEEIAEATRMRTELEAERNAFKQVKPDYEDALKFVVDQQKQFYMLAGATEKDAMFATNLDAGRLIDGCRRQGKSVAETIYKLAELRGYKAPVAETAPVAVQPKAPTAEEKLAIIEEGRQMTSLSRGSHAASPTELTVDQIDNMSKQQFDAWIQNPKNAAYYRKILGA